MASFRAARRAFCTAAEAAPAPAPAPAPAGRWERLKNSKAGVWCRSLFSDYKEACREIVVGARDRPLKASVYVGLLGGAYACVAAKPDESSFQAALLDRSNQLALLSPWIRNAGSDLHVQNLVKLRNQGCLRHLSLGLFSLVYSADFDPDSALYEARCANLSVPWRELPGRVLDVGFAGRWWLLEKKMEDFDVNEAEFKHLPAHMQATAPPSVQEVERNERLHRESWLPLSVPGEETETETERTGDGQVKTVEVQEETETAQVLETVDSDVDSGVNSQLSETLDLNMDPLVTETEFANMDGLVVETVDAITEVLETEDAKVDSQFSETLDVNVDLQVMETEDTNVDSHDPKEQVESLDIKEETLVADLVDSKVDLHNVESEETLVVDVVDSKVDDAETANLQLDPQVVEAVDVLKEEVVLEPELHTTEQDQAV